MENLLSTITSYLGEKAIDLGGRVVLCVVVLIIGMQLIKVLRKIIKTALEKGKAEVGVIQFIDSFIKVAAYVVLAFMIASNFGLDAATIVAILGSCGVALGLALQGSLSNMAGGVLILLLKPFSVGDYIVEGTAGQEGVVTEIAIFYTVLTTADNKKVILPNGNLANNHIVNVTVNGCRRIDIPVTVAYGADLSVVKSVLLRTIERNDYSMKDKEMQVLVDELGPNGVQLLVRCWVKCENYWDIKFGLAESVKLALLESGVEIPFTQVVVHNK